MKDIVVKPFGALPCAAEVFTIRGIKADLDEFVIIGEEGGCHGCAEGTCDGYCGCHGMYASAIGATQKVLDKYSITLDEYNKITDLLEDEFAVGSCGWCI
jgi:hypothetical protein